MTTQQYSLRWNNYFRHLTTSLDLQRCSDDFVDVSLFCEGRKIRAHKVVLSACSSYFKEIFKENQHPHPVIVFKFIKYDDLSAIIDFMYQGEVNVQQEQLQSFLQTAELLAVQGLTAEEKEKPKLSALIEETKSLKTIPSTIRAVAETATTTQTIEIPAATLLAATTQQLQQQQTQSQNQNQAHMQIQHLQLQTQPQIQVQQQQPQQQPSHPPQTQQVQVAQLQTPQQHHQTLTGQPITLNTGKKRKLTFSDDDDNLYTAEGVDYGVKDDPTIVKSPDIAFLRNAVKMDMPEYIVTEVEENDQLTDNSGQQSGQDDSGPNGQSVSQFTSEYEILTESEIEEKYHVDPDNTEITIEMGRLLNPTTNEPHQANLDDSGGSDGGLNIKTDSKGIHTGDMSNNKWTQCQFCKMTITTVNLWRHIRTQHTPQPPRKCEMCNKNFKNKYSLREHIRISHEQKIMKEN